jgi:hypothetical protein
MILGDPVSALIVGGLLAVTWGGMTLVRRLGG